MAVQPLVLSRLYAFMASVLRPASLKARIALGAAILVAFIATVLTGTTVLVAQRGIEDVVRDREAASVAQIARDLDMQMLVRKNALVQLAADLADELRTDGASPQRLQGMLGHHRALAGLFSNLLLLDPAGVQLANLQAPHAVGRASHGQREHFIATLRTGTPHVSRPVAGLVDGRPIIVITAPLLDREGRVQYLLFGHIDLKSDGFLNNMSHARIGQAGGYYLLSQDGIYISHADKARVLQPVEALRGDNPALVRALAGEGSALRGTDRNGVEALVSTHKLSTTGWVVAAVYPTAHAFAFADEVRVGAAAIALLLLVVVAPLAWLMIDHQLRPLSALAARMRLGQWQAQEQYASGEVGELTRAFDQLMAERQRAAQELADSERHLRLVANNVPALVAYVDSDRRFVFGNERYQAIFGVGAEALRGMRVRDVLGEEVYAISEHCVEAALRGELVNFERPVMRAGRLQWDRVQYRPDFDPDGTVRGYFALVDDISELKAYQAVLAASEKRIRTITDNLPALIGYIDVEHRYRFCNSHYAEVTGLPLEEIIGKTVGEIFGHELQASIATRMEAVLRGERISFEHVPPSSGGRVLHYDYIPDVDNDGRVQGFYSMVQDITERKATEKALMTQQRLLRSVADNLPALVSSMDRNGIMLFANRGHEDWLGVPLSRIEGQPMAGLLTAPEHRAHLDLFEQALGGERVRSTFMRTVRGEERHFQADYIPQVEGGETVAVTCLINDVTENKLVEQKLLALARFDALTGLPNRTQLTERIERAIVHSGRSGAQIALMYLDLDNFKSINDSFGHAGGDAVLIEFGRRLSSCVRQTDTVGRLAGDEFVILLEGLHSEAESALVANKILRAMERPFDIDGVARIVTTSIGVTTSTSAAAAVDVLLKHADEALYRAKQRGRNRFATTAMT